MFMLLAITLLRDSWEQRDRGWTLVCTALIVGFAAKTGFEFVTGTTLPAEAINFSKEHLAYVVGMRMPLKIKDGRVLLGSWKLMFQGEPRDVRISIASEGVLTCKDTEGCPGSGTRAVYVGTIDANQISEVFGAGCVPAWLNPQDEPDLTPLTGNSSWQDVDRAKARKPRR